MELEVAMTYARALYDAAKDLGHVEEVQDEIIALDKIFRQEKDLKYILKIRRFPALRKRTP